MGSRVVPPAIVGGMTKLDRQKFRLVTKLPYFVIAAKLLGRIHGLPAFKKARFVGMLNFKTVQDSEECQSEKLVFLNPEKFSSDSTESLRKHLKAAGVDKVTFSERNVTFQYENWHWKQCIDAILSPSQLAFGGFSAVGHIVHCNLEWALLPYKWVIGEILLDKVVSCQTVVNKVEQIDNEFRSFRMEILAGKQDFVTQVKEGKCVYRLDFSKVFWNSRLSTEHERLCTKFDQNSVVFDVFAGIGPFAVPAAKKPVQTVIANDLNPDAVRYLRENVQLNKVQDKVQTHNLDGQLFIKQIVKSYLMAEHHSETSAVHIVMNLPMLAATFLPHFVGLLNDVSAEEPSFPVFIHCYVFSKATDANADETFFKEDARRKVVEELKWPYLEIDEIYRVRDVARLKEMLCVSFRIPYRLLTFSAATTSADDSAEPAVKKCKCSQSFS